ncbi:oxidoreductase [Moniliophthora roreri]|nr:oxidoreductase [Moniliophthora roreri]
MLLDRPISNHTSRNGSPLRPAYNSSTSFKPNNAHVADEIHPIFHEGRVAVVTGAASGIGRAACIEFAKLKLKVAIADVDEVRLQAVGKELVALIGETNVLIVPTDVSEIDQVVRLKERVYEAWGEGAPPPIFTPPTVLTFAQVAVLMNNAGIAPKGSSWGGIDNWKKVFDVNVFGIVNVQQTFVPHAKFSPFSQQPMIHQENEALIINTGSKQGITNPPGNAAYNASKAAVKSLTESLAYELRERPDSHVTAHLFIPGWTYTGLTGAHKDMAKPEGAWTPQETVLYMLDKVRAGDFYVLVPDNETRREVDELRIMWGAGDIVERRPALSRWHRDYKALFEEYVRDGLGMPSSEGSRSY